MGRSDSLGRQDYDVRRLTMPDLTTPKGVRSLMRSSLSLDDWNRNCTIIRDANLDSPKRLEIERLMISVIFEEVRQLWSNMES